MFRNAGLVLGVLSVLLLTGCDTGPQPQPIRDPLAKQAPPAPKRTTPKAVKLAYPITAAKGKWTVKVAFFYPQGESTAAQLADASAQAYRKNGREAYVTDMGTQAILSVGSFNDPKDPRLIEVWRQEYNGYLRMRGGQESTFQKELDRFHEGTGALGDHPWPMEIEPLQMRMKVTQGKITPEQYAKYRESITSRQPGAGKSGK